jgi:hypothetical protein
MASERERTFPVLAGSPEAERQRAIFGRTVPWAVIEIIRAEALRAHSQSLEKLAERGGLSWSEIGSLFVAHHSRSTP